MAEDKIIVALDSQRLDGIQYCEYYYKLKFMTGLRAENTPVYLERGGLLHEMLACYYNMKKHRERWHKNNKTHADVVQSAITAGRFFGAKCNLSIAEIERTIDVFEEYTSYWENDSWNNIIAVEQVGSKILFEDENLVILYEVKMDLILDDRGKMKPVDHKHAQARRDPNELSNQFKGYCWFLGVNEIIINEVGFQKTVKPVDKFNRHVLQYSDSQLSEWVENTVEWIFHLLDCTEKERWKKNYTSCDKFSGCTFRADVCSQDPEVREYKLQTMFNISEWNPAGKL
jgi:hypothetical protein